ncbi:hypothetical protein [Legionella beliardensis]|nr:hypothetical protein [Legionella beliardensis]
MSKIKLIKKLARKEKKSINKLEQECALIVATYLQYPTNFDLSIACLKTLENLSDAWLKIFSNHLEKRQQAEDTYRKTHFSFFKKQAAKKFEKEKKIIKAVHKQVQCQTVCFEQKGDRRPFARNLTQLNVKTDNNNKKYIMKFSDNSFFTFNSLEDKSHILNKIAPI